MKRNFSIILLPLVVYNNESCAAFVSRVPLHMTNNSQGKNSSNGSRIPPSVSSSPVTTSASSIDSGIINSSPSTAITPDVNQGDQTGSKTNRGKEIYRQKSKQSLKKAAPLVDSTLLRFLSKQKSQLKETEAIRRTNPKETSLSSTDTGITIAQMFEDGISENKDSNENEDMVHNHSDENLASSSSKTKNNKEIARITADNAAATTIEDTAADTLSWYTQYNAHRVAQKLIVLGASEDVAIEAGTAVQNYALARTTRQRIRKFLRDRDLKWARGESVNSMSNDSKLQADSEESKNELSNIIEEAKLRRERHDIDEIMNLMVESGLTGKDIAAIFTHTPSVSMMKARKSPIRDEFSNTGGETLEDTIHRSLVQVLSKKIKLRKYDARKVLRYCPGLLTKRGSTAALEVVNILTNLGVAPTSLVRDKAALPMLLSRSPASLFRFVAFLSSDYIQMPVSKIGPFIRRSECAPVLDQIAPLPCYNSNLFEGLNDNSACSSEESNPIPIQNLLKDRSDNLEKVITERYSSMYKTAELLKKEIGIEDMGKILAAYPQIFSIERDTIVNVVNFLHEELELYHDDIAKMIESFPKILETDVERMSSVIEYLRYLGVAEDALGSIFRAFPALLSKDPEASMKEVVDFLEEIGVTNIGRFITRLPPVLGYSVQKDLKPKWEYLGTVCQFASFEIGRFPAYFSYPLDRVIKSRYEYLKFVKRYPVQLLPVDEILRFGDDDFAMMVAKDDDANSYRSYLRLRNETKMKGKKRTRMTKNKFSR